MQHEVAQLLGRLVWWGLVAVFGLMALVYARKLCQLLRDARREPKAVCLEQFVCIWHMPVWLLIWLAFTRETELCQISRQAYLCLGLWLFTCGCAMIQKKVASRMVWRDYMHKQGRKFLGVFTDIRRVLLWVEAFKDKLPVRVRASIALCAIAIFGWSAYLLQDNQEGLTILLGASSILFFISAASFSLHSCRKLLLLWLPYSTLFALTVVAMLPRIQSGFFDAMAYACFVFLYTLLWLFLAGAADDEPVKLVCEFVNTITSIALIVINVVAEWGERNLILPASMLPLWSTLQYYSTVILLPLVMAEYLATLLKSIQVYQKQRDQEDE